MAPILIDSRGLIKLGFISFLSTAVFFVAGVVFGYQRASSHYLVESERMPLPLPEKAAEWQQSIDPQVPVLIAAGEDIDVDVPRHKINAGVAEKVKKLHPDADMQTKISAHSVAQLIEKERDVSSQNAAGASQAERYTSAGFTEEEKQSNTTHNMPEPAALDFSSDHLSTIKYSVQVGMYGRLDNAENMMNQLRDRHLSAYVSEYTNSQNETRYNVRYGLFKDKKSAMTALQDYKKLENAEAYLVSFSEENITSIAGVEKIKPAEIIENTERVISPASMPVNALEEKVSQADILNTAKQQAGIATN